MAEDIQLLANQLIYNGRLRCGSEAVKTQALETHIAEDGAYSEWMLKVGLCFLEAGQVKYKCNSMMSS